MARWKARVDVLLSVIERLFLSVTIERYKAKRVKPRCFQEGVGQFEPRFQGKRSSLGYIFSFYKTRHILLSDSANYIILRPVVLTQYGPVTDRQTDRRTGGQTELL